MITWKELSFPTRTLALVIACVAIGLALYLPYRFVYGKLVVTSPVQNALVFLDRDELSQSVPTTYRLKPGKATVYVTSSGYLTAEKKITVLPFVSRKVSVPLVKDYGADAPHFSITYQYERGSYLIVPKVNFTALESPESQLATQWPVYEAYAKEALASLKARGADPKQLKLEWWAQEWWPKGKAIKL